MQVVVELKGDVRNQNFAVSKLEVAASPVSLHATGKIEPAGSEHQLTSDRITSYNVCYTKLLRMRDPEAKQVNEAKEPIQP